MFRFGFTRLGITTAMVTLVECSEPDRTRAIGLLNGQPERVATIEVPSQVQVGSAFSVTVITFGSSNCTWPAGEEVTTASLLLRLVPYDEVPIDPATTCLRDLKSFPHSRQLQLDMPGEARLRVVGYFGQGEVQVLDSIEVPIQVNP
jgi:hypothetical protein